MDSKSKLIVYCLGSEQLPPTIVYMGLASELLLFIVDIGVSLVVELGVRLNAGKEPIPGTGPDAEGVSKTAWEFK